MSSALGSKNAEARQTRQDGERSITGNHENLRQRLVAVAQRVDDSLWARPQSFSVQGCEKAAALLCIEFTGLCEDREFHELIGSRQDLWAPDLWAPAEIPQELNGLLRSLRSFITVLETHGAYLRASGMTEELIRETRAMAERCAQWLIEREWSFHTRQRPNGPLYAFYNIRDEICRIRASFTKMGERRLRREGRPRALEVAKVLAPLVGSLVVLASNLDAETKASILGGLSVLWTYSAHVLERTRDRMYEMERDIRSQRDREENDHGREM